MNGVARARLDEFIRQNTLRRTAQRPAVIDATLSNPNIPQFS